MKFNAKKESKSNLKIIFIAVRYIILLFSAFSLSLIYKILTPITLFSLSNLLKLFFNNVLLNQNFIIINSNYLIEIIPACVAGSAYLLLLILNLSVPMNLKKRICSLFFSFLILFILNTIRIFIFSILFYNNFLFLDFIHKFFWYVLSTVFVVGIWFFAVRIFQIKEIPVYSDLRFLIKIISRRKACSSEILGFRS